MGVPPVKHNTCFAFLDNYNRTTFFLQLHTISCPIRCTLRKANFKRFLTILYFLQFAYKKREPLETTAFQGALSCRSGGIRTRGLSVPNRPLRGPGILDFTAFEAFSRHWELMSCHRFLLMKMQLSINFHTTLGQLSNNIAITAE